MTGNDLIALKEWFSAYCRSFYFEDSEDQKNISLKEEHTHNVCINILEVARDLSFDANKMLLSETAALFHDVGRFPQYARYKTFNDRDSVNHGLLGANTLAEGNVLDILPGKEKDLVLQAVKFHNAYALPDLPDQDAILFLKLLRDADKLDIWRVFIENFEGPPALRASAVALGFPDVPGYSEKVIAAFHEKRSVLLTDARTLNDIKLLGLSWVFDLNFGHSFRMVIERGYLPRIMTSLPSSDELAGVSSLVEEFVHSKARWENRERLNTAKRTGLTASR